MWRRAKCCNYHARKIGFFAEQRKLYKEKRDFLHSAFRKCSLPACIPEGGYFYFLLLNKNVDIDKLNALKSKYDISFDNCFDIIPEKFKGEFSEYKNTVRLSISSLPENILKEACEAFIKMVAEAVIV